MSININSVKELVYAIAAKQQQAFPSPQNFNQYAQLANIDLYNYYQDERQKMLLKVKAGQTLYAPQVLTTFVAETLLSPSVQSPSLPADYVYDISMRTNGFVNVKKVDYDKVNTYVDSTIDEPTQANPIYVEYASAITTYPTLNTPTYLTYYKYPITPVWGYTLSPRPTYDPNTSTNFDWRETEFLRLSARILKYMSISIRDQELEQQAQQLNLTAS